MSVLRSVRLTLPADVDNDGTDETGVFDLSAGIRFSPGAQMGKLIGARGQLVNSAINFVTNDDSPRGGFTLDAGTGAYIAEIDFQYFEGSDGRWGDGSNDAAADAEGEGVWRQLSVFQRYLNQGTYDSLSPATLEWGEYHSGGEYASVDVTISETATLSFDATEETSVTSGSIQLVATRDVAQKAASQQQDAR